MVQSVYSKYTNDGTIFQYVRQKYQSHVALVQHLTVAEVAEGSSFYLMFYVKLKQLDD